MEEERYTYGYQNGWNVENEYINNLKPFFTDYDSQMERLNFAIQDRNLVLADIRRNERGYTDEELLETYNRYGSERETFDQYKQGINQEREARALRLRQDLERSTDRYSANLYYLIEIKHELRRSLTIRRREIQETLDQVKLNLRQIELYQRSTPTTDRDRLMQLRSQYDSVSLDIQKLEHAVRLIDEKLVEINFTEEENALMLSGLNPQARREYQLILERQASKTPVSEKEVPEKTPIDPF